MKYYCNTCGRTLDENDIIYGYATAIDEYTNDKCGYCESEELQEINDSELCPHCAKYHERAEWYDECAKEIYTELWALRYIADDIQHAMSYMNDYNICLREYVLYEPKLFVEFVCERERAEIQERIQRYERAGVQPEIIQMLKKEA